MVRNAVGAHRQDLVEFQISAAGHTEPRWCVIDGQVSRPAALPVDAPTVFR